MTTGLVSVVIPSRNEPYLNKTIQDILAKASGDIEVIAVLDGYWPDEMIDDKRVIYIHFSEARGMRNAINSGVGVSHGEFILKCDAHVMFSEGFDHRLKQVVKDNWVVVPRRYALDPELWAIEERSDDKYPIDYMYLSKELHAEPWKEKNQDASLKDKLTDELMSFQGSCWFMKKSYYEYLELMDEANYGKFSSEAQEIGLKAWLSGGKVVVDKLVWYAHWHKTKGRGYNLAKGEQEKGWEYTKKWITDFVWRKQLYPIEMLVSQFAPVPGWE